MIRTTRRCLLALLIPALAISSTAHAQLGLAMQEAQPPTSKWVVNYAEDMCTIERNYGTLSSKLVFGIRAETMGFGGQIIILKQGGLSEFRDRSIKIILDPVKPPLTVQATAQRIKDDGTTKFTFRLDRDQMTELEKSYQIKISDAGHPIFALSLPAMRAGLAALETCRVDLVAGWGIAPADQKRIKSGPKVVGGSVIRLFQAGDYPTEALRQNQQGVVRFRVDVYKTGKVKDCIVTHSSGVPSLDTETCSIVRSRAHYSPAVDVEGEPKASIEVDTITWLIPSQ